MPKGNSVHDALQAFAEAVKAKSSQTTAGEPEDQLRGPFENFMAAAAAAFEFKVVCTGETPLPDQLGRPDFAVHLRGLLSGYVELKAPGVGADAPRFRGRNRKQWDRFKSIPNLLYSDGAEWALYRSGVRVRDLVRLSGNPATEGAKAVAPRDALEVENLLRLFLEWEPFIPRGRDGIDLRAFADVLAPLCRMLRDDVTDALRNTESPLVALARDWRELLFPDAEDPQFADAYAQTVTFALLLGRSEGADPLTFERAEAALAAEHTLLSRALQVLTDTAARAEISAPLDLLLRVIGALPPTALASSDDPWLYFYEHFLAAYDEKLRKDYGVYYTPVEVVRAQVRLIDDLLVNRLEKPLGFADPGVVTLDPAAGTGTYLLGVIDHALGRIEDEQGPGAVPAHASALAANIYAFELMVGPFAVTELRTTRAVRDRGGRLPSDGTHVYLTDTLESPHTVPPQLALILRPIAQQHAKALSVKSNVPVIVCLGNPPYDRTKAAEESNRARTGGWVRWGDEGSTTPPIFRDFLQPALDAGHGVRVHNLYNLYVYFWRWALWKVFEHETATGPGIASFITASSYLDGDAFCGMREHLRRLCDEVWILDLGGEGRGARRSENVFAIQTPVAIAVAFRSGEPRTDQPAAIHYAPIDGTRRRKLASLAAIDDLASVEWAECPTAWQAPFRPAGTGAYFDWPLLTDLMPWQQSGVKAGRTWVICPEEQTLQRRWLELLRSAADARSRLFKNSRFGRKAHEAPPQLPPAGAKLTPITELAPGAPSPATVRFAYRSFDRQFVLADGRLLDRPSPIWSAHGPHQVYVTSSFSCTLGVGPALTPCSDIPDLDHFRGSYGAKNVVPLYRDAEGTQPNILPGLLDLLREAYHREVTPEAFLAYVYGMLAQPAFTARFTEELDKRQVRVPITRDAALFESVRAVGARLLWLHTYGERFLPKGHRRGHVPRGAARCVKPVPEDPARYPDSFSLNDVTGTLHVGDGEFAPVARDVYEFDVSGLKVVQSWLAYRKKGGAGRKSSPLDDIRPERWTRQFTTELLELLWVLEATIAGYPEQAKLLEAVLAGPCFCADELPEVPDIMRKSPPARPADVQLSNGL